MRWLVNERVKGRLEGPWIAWGPYLWTNGERGRKDGLVWTCADTRSSDGTHPSESGQAKVVVADGAEEPKAAFTATALSENADGMAAVSGDGQSGPAGATAAILLALAFLLFTHLWWAPAHGGVDQNGYMVLSVPAMGCAVGEFSG